MSTIVELATELRELKSKKDGIDSAAKEINTRIEEITKKLLPDMMYEQGITNIKIEGVGSLHLRGEVYASILAENRELAYEWLRDHGKGSIIQESINSSTLKAAAKEWIKNGEEIPENLIKITPITMAVLLAK